MTRKCYHSIIIIIIVNTSDIGVICRHSSRYMFRSVNTIHSTPTTLRHMAIRHHSTAQLSALASHVAHYIIAHSQVRWPWHLRVGYHVRLSCDFILIILIVLFGLQLVWLPLDEGELVQFATFLINRWRSP